MNFVNRGIVSAIASNLQRTGSLPGVPAGARDLMLQRAAKLRGALTLPDNELLPVLAGRLRRETVDPSEGNAEFAQAYSEAMCPYRTCQPAGELRMRITGEFLAIPYDLGSLLDGVRTVRVWLDSPGGNGVAAITMFRLLADRDTVTTCRFAGSAAALIFQAGRVRRILRDGGLLIHAPHAVLCGNARDLRHEAGQLESWAQEQISLYQGRSGLPRAVIEEWFNGDDVYLEPEDALKFGLADEIVDSVPAWVNAGTTATATILPVSGSGGATPGER